MRMSEYGCFVLCLFVFHCHLKRDMDEDSEQNLEELIVTCFRRGFLYQDILKLVKKRCDITLSIRTFHRIRKGLNLKRKNVSFLTNELINHVQESIESGGENRGYRNIRQRLIQKGKPYTFNSVRLALKSIDPDGVARRSKHRLKRRKYINCGPSYVWHIDGNDKLKPFGFCIHAGIDGFSRKILWLKVSYTNKDPKVVCQYYLDAITTLGALPKKVRTDRGTENVDICSVQTFLRRNHDDSLSGNSSFPYGKSVSNQRIEAWWSVLKRDTLQTWINYFKDLRESGVYDDSDIIHVEALRFCFYASLQEDLDDMTEYWNNHKIRKSHAAESPDGRPEFMYCLPEDYGGNESKVPMSLLDFSTVSSIYSTSANYSFCCSMEFVKLATAVMSENNLPWPSNRDESETLFLKLTNVLGSIQ